MTDTPVKTPWHLWVIGIVTLLWNAMGAFDYTATQMKIESYMASFTPEQLAYFYGFPAWAKGFWAIAVWSSVLGSIALLMRKSWAVMVFGISLVGLLGTSIYNLVLTDGLAQMGDGAEIFTVLIWVITILLFFYARAMAARKVLN